MSLSYLDTEADLKFVVVISCLSVCIKLFISYIIYIVNTTASLFRDMWYMGK